MRSFASRRLSAFAALLAPLLTTCGTSDAASVEAQAEANETAFVPAHTKSANAQVRAITEHHPESARCGGDGMRLIVLRGSRDITGHEYCSAYGNGGARTVT